MKKAVFAAAAALLSGSAFAADMPVKTPAPAFSWSGCYIGVQGGWGFGDSEGAAVNSTRDLYVSYELDLDGGIAGGHVGCQWQNGAWVIGFEGDGDWTDINDSQRFTTDRDYTISTHIQGTGSARARFGWAADRLLLYVTGGWAIAGVKTKYAVADLAPFHTEDKARNGWTVGGGVEWAFLPSWSARVDYRYTDFGSKSFSDPIVDVSDDNKLSFSAVRFGVSYHFGDPVTVVTRY